MKNYLILLLFIAAFGCQKPSDCMCEYYNITTDCKEVVRLQKKELDDIMPALDSLKSLTNKVLQRNRQVLEEVTQTIKSLK